jgi:F0F1-type ATP synthase alpha subunit
MAMAESFRDQGKDVLVVLDDMTTHAKFYRELSLLSRKFPGRDSYPGDIFHVNSKLVERAGNFNVGDKEVAITCLPIAEVVGSDLTGYIQTNLMSMTDGHILFDSALYAAGRRPAVNSFLSVTRVGHQTQDKLRRDINQKLFDLLNDYERTQSFLRFGAELGENSRQILATGEKVIKFFDQPLHNPVPLNLAIILLALLWSGSWDGTFAEKIITAYASNEDTRTKYNKILQNTTEFLQLVDSARLEADNLLSSLK